MHTPKKAFIGLLVHHRPPIAPHSGVELFFMVIRGF
jgi:hypothetical protein